MSIDLSGITKTFDGYQALRGINLQIEKGQFLALLGPSGSGKTTLLRILAGLDFPDEGRLVFDGSDVQHIGARDRRVGFVFQHYALFRHMTVAENIAFGLKVRPRHERPSKAEIAERVNHLLRLVQLEKFGNRYPTQLSGGQRQRIALARALAIEPNVLLLDEPFGALDAKVRKDLRRWLRQLHDEMGLTSIFVTHDQEEALELADQVAVMSEGRIEQIGTPDQVYHSPATPFVFEFLGHANRFSCRIDGDVAHIGAVTVPVQNLTSARPIDGIAFVRPHDITLHREQSAARLPVRIRHMFTAGPNVRVELERLDNGEHLVADLSHEQVQKGAFATSSQASAELTQVSVFPAH
jgi:sulfate transport system ATP-binding protein